MSALSPLAEACADVRLRGRVKLSLDGAIETVTETIDRLSRGRTDEAKAILQAHRDHLRSIRREL